MGLLLAGDTILPSEQSAHNKSMEEHNKYVEKTCEQKNRCGVIGKTISIATLVVAVATLVVTLLLGLL